MTGKTLFRTIKASFGRYMAILAIIALGIGFFTGLKSAQPSMQQTAHDYLEEQNHYDFQLMSTLGLTSEDIEAFAQLEQVTQAEGGYRLEAMASVDDLGSGAYLFLSLPACISTPKLMAGRMPENENECLVDSFAFEDAAIGSILTVTDEEGELHQTEFTIVGRVQSSRYLSKERGNTSLGDGTLRGFIYLPIEVFDAEVYHEVLTTVSVQDSHFSSAYDERLDEIRPVLEELLEERGDLRYQSLYDEAMEALSEARQELNDGWKEWDDGRKELSEGRQEVADGRKELENARRDLDKGYAEVSDGWREVSKGRQEIQDGWRELEEARKELDAGREQMEASRQQLIAARQELDAGWMQYNGALAMGYPAAMLTETKVRLDAGETELAAGEAQLQAAEEELSAGEAEWEAGKAELLNAETELQQAEAELREAEADLMRGEADWMAGTQELADAEVEIRDAEAELAEGRVELEKGETEYQDGLRELKKLKKPTLYLLDGDSNTGYASFKNDSTIVNSIANAFPVFFVLIAALVCITTMTRMVNEERTQIGTLKALGYPAWVISMKYILYAGSAGLFGSLLGFFGGTRALPFVIWAVYGINYGFAPLQYAFLPVMCGVCIAVSVCGSALVTMLACGKELDEHAAELIRPKAPGSGKRILLEHITPVWNHLSFLNKVMLRNAFRYKKRMLMMLVGISGCTALMVTGFGLRDSITNILDYQYDEIHLYDASVSFEEGETTAQELLEQAGAAYQMGYQENGTIYTEHGEKEANLLVLPQGERDTFFDLHSGKTAISYPGQNEVVLTAKLADKLGVKAGDSVRVHLKEQDYMLTVTAIADNYLNHYAYFDSTTMENYVENTAWYTMPTQEETAELAVKLRGEDGVGYVSVVADQRAVMASTMSSMDYIVVVVILCAGALAFIVLYNLTNINIMERIREVATVKVLGFHGKETAAYVLRENIMLSALGGLLGLGLGKLLHYYVMQYVQVELLSFEIRVAPLSYVISFTVTIVFAVLANLFMRVKLRQVNMAESLKSVE